MQMVSAFGSIHLVDKSSRWEDLSTKTKNKIGKRD